MRIDEWGFGTKRSSLIKTRNSVPSLGKTLLSEAAIKRRVRELGREIRRYYGKRPPIVLGLMNGALFFLVDVLRELPPDFEVRCISVTSYQGSQSTGKIKGLSGLGSKFKGRDVLLIDDILDTGRTLAAVRERLLAGGARRVSVCVFLSKKKSRCRAVRARWTGFDIEDEFVVGYGLDWNGLYRGLKTVRIMEVEKS
jgi:hypoxanthine phosphoribosyltransferase